MSKGTVPRKVRGIPDDLWQDFGAICRREGTDRSSIIRKFVFDFVSSDAEYSQARTDTKEGAGPFGAGP